MSSECTCGKRPTSDGSCCNSASSKRPAVSEGYSNLILLVDLTKGELKVIETPQEMKKKWMGGRGFGIKFVSEGIFPTVDALDPRNVLVFSPGPVTGTGVPSGARCAVATKAPLTNTLASCSFGGTFGITLKRAGYDAVVIRGKSASPVMLVLKQHEEPKLVPADDLWGKVTSETFKILGEKYGDPHTTSFACIGPAGEKMAKIACIMSDEKHAAGRGGMGAVMGSKMLKAIIAQGRGMIQPNDPKKLHDVIEDFKKKFDANPVCGLLKAHGTNVLTKGVNAGSILPTHNYQTGHFPDELAEPTTGEYVTEHYLKQNEGCGNCVIRCGRVINLDGKVVKGPEYETVWAFGADCGVSDTKAIFRANLICNEWGVDTISAGATVACAMEMSEKGIIPEKYPFGDPNVIVDLTTKIGKMEGIGAEMADGSLRFATKYGHPELSMSVKGQELPAYDPRGLQGLGLNYSTSVRGGCHVYGYMTAVEHVGVPAKLDPLNTGSDKVATTIAFQDLTAVIDSSGMCLFSSFALGCADYTAVLNAVTGLGYTEEEVMKVGARIWNCQKLFNLKGGISKEHDTLPRRLLTEPLLVGNPKGHVWHREEMLDEYYKQRGWDKDGIPTVEKCNELGISY